MLARCTTSVLGGGMRTVKWISREVGGWVGGLGVYEEMDHKPVSVWKDEPGA